MPRNTWSLVVSAIRESQTEESTSRLRAVPKVTKLLSAMAGTGGGTKLSKLSKVRGEGWNGGRTRWGREKRGVTRRGRKKGTVKIKDRHTARLHTHTHIYMVQVWQFNYKGGKQTQINTNMNYSSSETQHGGLKCWFWNVDAVVD